MHVLLVHNEYGRLSGEEIVVRRLHDILVERGHRVTTFFRSSAEIATQAAGAAKAWFSGVYSVSSRAHMRRLLAQDPPDIVHVHNVFPLISPSVLGECRNVGVPVVMTVHNYRLICPSGLFLANGQVCEQCAGGREYNCLLKRCESSLAKSAGYALRNAVARKFGFFQNNVSIFATLTQFQRDRLITAGYPAERICVIPNMVDSDAVEVSQNLGNFVGYAGRVSHEKGILTLLEAARRLPHIPFRIAGTTERMPEVRTIAPPNVHFTGHLSPDELAAFYANCRIVTLCSTWFEGFPMMLAEAMLYAKPIVCSRIGGLGEIVDDNQTGLLFTPGNTAELARTLSDLFASTNLCAKMGQAGRAKALQQYSTDKYYQRTIAAYEHAMQHVSRSHLATAAS